MSDWKKIISDAKELLDIGAITEVEFEEAKQKAFMLRDTGQINASNAMNVPNLEDIGTRIQTPTNPGVQPSPSVADLGTVVGDVNSTGPNIYEHASVVENNPPKTVGSYRIVELLGQGGMGAVYRGRHINTQYAKATGDVAIKMIQPYLADNEDFKNRFIKEAIFGKKLSHPNIASVIDVVDNADVLALLMDFVEGKELSELIPKDGMPAPEVIRLLKPIASALDYLHAEGVIHRDMKPANVRVTSDGTPVILDFGIAKDTNEVDSGMTQTGTAMGTQTYMAPEQMDAKRVTGAADQYALAMMAYQMLSGLYPWSSELSSARITLVKLTGDVVSLETVTDVPLSLAQCVMKGLSIHPEERFDSCMAFVQALHDAKEDKNPAALASSVSETTTMKTPPPSVSNTSQETPPRQESSSSQIPDSTQKSNTGFVVGIGILALAAGLGLWMTNSESEEQNDVSQNYEEQNDTPERAATQPAKTIPSPSNLADGDRPIQHVGQTHCSSNELIVFNCTTTNSKIVSVCASKDASYNNGYMQYHYGKLGNKDTYFPKNFEPANGSFTFQTGFGAHSENVAIKVVRGKYSYTMRASLDPTGDGNQGDIVVAKSGKTLTVIPCREYPEHLSAASYKSLGVVETY